MSEHHGWENGAQRDEVHLVWPDYPDILTTLLAAVGVAGIFLGMGALTEQGWVTWVGLVVAAGVLGSHVVRYRRATAQRALAQQLLGARLISHCRRLGGPSFVQSYFDGMERVVLLLTDDALHICQNDPSLQIATTLHFYEIRDVQIGRVEAPLWDADLAGETLENQEGVLNLAVQRGGARIYRLAFSGFESHAPAESWHHALARVVERPAPSADKEEANQLS